MSKTAAPILILIAALAGAAIALAVGSFTGTPTIVNNHQDLLARVINLEAELQAEREAREQIMVSLDSGSERRIASTEISEASELSATNEGIDQDSLTLERIAAIEEASNSEFSAESRAESRRLNRKRALISGGFDETEANWILNNEAQVQLDELFDQHRIRRAALAEQSAESNLWFNRQTRQDRLREKLGDEAFERYLKANGWPTSARVQSVIDGSPAALAGLKDGDKIVSYAGQRVYNLRDVNRLTLQGNEGESVLIEVERDGNRVQVTLPRGPVGVSGG